LLHATRQVNAARLGAATAWLRDQLGSLDGRRITVAGIAFKPGTDDTRESPGLALAELLARAGADVTGYDPDAAPVAGLHVERDARSALDGADALVIAHHGHGWPAIDPVAASELMAGRAVFDAPGALDAAAWQAAGFALNRAPRQGHDANAPATV
jgi:UDPglucose 6-dehydrogenase